MGSSKVVLQLTLVALLYVSLSSGRNLRSKRETNEINYEALLRKLSEKFAEENMNEREETNYEREAGRFEERNFPSVNDERDEEFSKRIIGGSYAQKHAYPFMAWIKYGDVEHKQCGASLIDPQFVLTSARCVVDYVNRVHDITVWLGDHSSYDTEAGVEFDRKPSKIIVQPGSHDLALIKLERPIALSSAIQPISYAGDPSQFEFAPGQRHGCKVLGWGQSSRDPNAEFEAVLKELDVDLMEGNECGRMKQRDFVKTHEICVFGRHSYEHNICEGDLGGPLFCPVPSVNQFGQIGNALSLVGVASYISSHGERSEARISTRGCPEPGNPSIFVDVGAWSYWITNTLKREKQQQ